MKKHDRSDDPCPENSVLMHCTLGMSSYHRADRVVPIENASRLDEFVLPAWIRLGDILWLDRVLPSGIPDGAEFDVPEIPIWFPDAYVPKEKKASYAKKRPVLWHEFPISLPDREYLEPALHFLIDLDSIGNLQRWFTLCVSRLEGLPFGGPYAHIVEQLLDYWGRTGEDVWVICMDRRFIRDVDRFAKAERIRKILENVSRTVGPTLPVGTILYQGYGHRGRLTANLQVGDRGIIKSPIDATYAPSQAFVSMDCSGTFNEDQLITRPSPRDKRHRVGEKDDKKSASTTQKSPWVYYVYIVLGETQTSDVHAIPSQLFFKDVDENNSSVRFWAECEITVEPDTNFVVLKREIRSFGFNDRLIGCMMRNADDHFWLYPVDEVKRDVHVVYIGLY